MNGCPAFAGGWPASGPGRLASAPWLLTSVRVFFCTAGRKIILLLGGYDKARDPSDRRQQREITKARRLLTAYRESQRRSGKRR